MSQRSKIEAVLASCESLTQNQIAQAIYGDTNHCSAIYMALQKMVDEGILKKEGKPAHYSVIAGHQSEQSESEKDNESITTLSELFGKIRCALDEIDNLSFGKLKKMLDISDVEETQAKKIYNELTRVKLSYSTKKKTIPAITKQLENLINEYDLDFDKEKNIVLLTKKNADIIENLIKNDPSYFPFAKTVFERFGWKNVKINKDRALFAVLREIDRDNSTNVWRYSQNRANFLDAVDYMGNPENGFFKILKKGDPQLPDRIVSKFGTGLTSLASKMCKYLCEYANFGDHYYINDKYIRHALPFYLDYYGIERKTNKKTPINSSRAVDNCTYEELFGLLRKLHEKRNEQYSDTITKSELDHIIWYCYKSFYS